MSAMNLMLAATHHKLVARPMAGFDPAKIRTAFGLEEEDEPQVMIAVGYESDDDGHVADHYREAAKKPRKRKAASEIVRQL
jgi:nitroreductase